MSSISGGTKGRSQQKGNFQQERLCRELNLCELLRRNAYRAPCSASWVPPCKHFRHHDFSAEDIARLFCKQTQSRFSGHSTEIVVNRPDQIKVEVNIALINLGKNGKEAA